MENIMADDNTAKGCSELEGANDAYEQDFRRRSTWKAFMGALFGAIGGAAFFAVFNTTATAVMEGTGLLAALSGAGPIVLIAIGAAAIFMAQKQLTELGCLRDDRLARHTAQEKAKAMAATKAVPQQATAPSITEEKGVSVDPGISVPTDRRFTDIIQQRPAVTAGAPQQSFAETAAASKAECAACHSK